MSFLKAFHYRATGHRWPADGARLFGFHRRAAFCNVLDGDLIAEGDVVRNGPCWPANQSAEGDKPAYIEEKSP
jgi:hypothetical protein